MASNLPLALALSLGVIAAAQAAEPEDHSSHAGHEAVAPEAAAAPASGDEHSAHHPQAPAPASTDQGMPMMDHSQMGHGGMSHEQMMQMHQRHMQGQQMDNGGMSHEQMMQMHQQHMNMQAQPQTAPAADHQDHQAHQAHHPAGYPGAAVAPLTDADRAAAFPDLPPHAMHRSGINYLFLADQLEWQDADDGSVLNWDLSGWVGGNVDRLAFRSEGERLNGHTEEAELQLLWSHAISPWWETVAGARQDFKPESPQTWAAFGVQGMPLYGLETEATAFLGEAGQSALRLAGEYDILLTNRLILQPAVEANLYGRNDEERGVGSGLSDLELGLRLRYEIRREFAPYIGVNWTRAYGNTADLLREDDEDVSEARLVAGIRFWF